MLEVEARQAASSKIVPLHKKLSTLYELVPFLEDVLAFLEPSFCTSVS